MRFSREVATRLVVRYVPMTPRISIRSRNGRMIWVRIRRVGSVSGRPRRGLANTVPTLRRHRVGGTEEDELIGAAVDGSKGVAGDDMQVGIAGRHLNRARGPDGPLTLVVDPHPLVGDRAAHTVGREATGGRDRGLRAAAAIAVVL